MNSSSWSPRSPVPGLGRQCLTAIAGSSAWFDRGFVTYSNEAKQEMLGVPPDMLAEHGAVSQPVAVAMAEGALRNSRADWAVAITGIAGPTGGSPQKPVGTVCFAWGLPRRPYRDFYQAFPRQSGRRACAIRGTRVEWAHRTDGSIDWRSRCLSCRAGYEACLPCFAVREWLYIMPVFGNMDLLMAECRT
jgi:competence/damage-inducible protein CinA C-terminal domain